MSSLDHNSCRTKRIHYDPDYKTFRLYPGNSLYAFSISPELSLEHLYWGKALQDGYDLRYLSQSSRTTHFSVAAEISDPNPEKLNIEVVTQSEDLAEIWKRCKNSSAESFSGAESFQNQKTPFSPKFSMNNVEEEKIEPKSFDSILPEEIAAPLIHQQNQKTPLSIECSIFESPDLFEASKRFFSATPNNTQPSPIYSAPSFSPLFANSSKLNNSPKPSRFSPLETRKKVFNRGEGQMGKGSLNSEYSDHGTGDFRTPSFLVVDNFDGSSISPLQYRSHEIIKGTPPMPDYLPCLRLNEDEATTLIVNLADQNSGLEVNLIYVVPHKYDAITRRAVFRNRRPNYCFNPSTSTSKVIHKASSITIDFESTSTPFHLVQLSGSWGRERQIVETKIGHGIQCIGSTKGVSGHQHNPFAAVTIGHPCETFGEVKGFSFVYSGNFLIETELSEIGRLRINVGINPMNLQWHLKSGGCFNTPECILVRSNQGLGGMSRELHRLFLDTLFASTPQWALDSPPVLINTWEGNYFNIDHARVLEIAIEASKVGIDLVVIDDGWFGERNDITSSLGDWFPNPKKFPKGLKALADEVNATGCRLGLWFEPEMVSERSKLYAKHPDWNLRVPGKPRSIGRHQFVLDLSRIEVRNYIFDAMSAILENANIEYIKWDMNRPLTEVYSSKSFNDESLPFQEEIVWQAEVSHRYMLGVYELLTRLKDRFPNILLETCASGGGRFDPGMLYFSPQIWCSDNTDAISRMKIQYGTSLAYPTRSIGSHVSSAPNHITGNTTRLRTRAFVAMCGTFGFELNLDECGEEEKNLFREQIKIAKSLFEIVFQGDLYRLWDPFKTNFAAWSFVSRSKSSAVVFAFSMNSDHWSNLAPRLMLQGLLPEAEYEITEPCPNNVTQGHGNLKIRFEPVPIYQLKYPLVILTGEILMSAGLPIKFFTLDDSHCFVLTEVNSQK